MICGLLKHKISIIIYSTYNTTIFIFQMHQHIIIILLLCITMHYLFLTFRVSHRRMQTGIVGPKMDGDDLLSCRIRAQSNTVEQLIIFFPLVLLCFHFGSAVATIVGSAMFLVGRIIYAQFYTPETSLRKYRAFGMMLTMLSQVVMIVTIFYSLVVQ